MFIATLSYVTGSCRFACHLGVILISSVTLPQVSGAYPKYNALPEAHAHNDYEHKRPLFDALEQGFVSIEADIWLVDGELYVAHDRTGMKFDRRLDNLYLEPIAEMFRNSRGSIFSTEHSLFLLIDIKSDGRKTYHVLKRLLAKYREEFSTTLSDGTPALRIILSGNRPVEEVTEDSQRLVSIDGRIAEMDKELGNLVILVSDNWRSHFSWNGIGMMPDDQRSKLRAIVAKVHKANSKLRFWATPENENVWKVLRDEGVDFIGTDQLQKLKVFLNASR